MSAHLQNIVRARRGVPVSKMTRLERENHQLWLWVLVSDSVIAAFLVWFGLWITGVMT